MYNSRLRALEDLKNKKPLVKEHGKSPTEVFGIDVFGEAQLKEKLPPSSWEAFQRCVTEEEDLDPNIADLIATAMKEWALSKNATHFTHWFQPLTGLTAEKHDSFISFYGGSYDRKMLMNFSGKQLIKGEPDASSFPSGGLRSTFEARGYTAWDMDSPSFIRNGANGAFLCIPSAFASWTGEALDMKTPLLRSNDAASRAAIRVLRILGDKESTHVHSNLGVEQEFFVIDRGFYNARPDLIACGRSLLGAQPSKGQQMEDHYFGALDRRILAFMQDVEWRLWRLGVPSTTRHNEVAPSQYELAPIFERVTVACDHNMVTMEILKEVAREHDLACLLHEKPFAGVNGSGKHNNWSLCTNTGINLMDPGKTPRQNERFLVFLAAVLRAVSIHGDLLRCSIANPGNEHRLGANEAPPAIISVFLGEQLEAVIEDIMGTETSKERSASKGEKPHIQLGVNSLPNLPRDASDRNRTSPFAFTGNKFEFRAVGSSQSCARPIMILNTIVADSLNYIADELEKELKKDGVQLDTAITNTVKAIFKDHHRVVFGGNGYSEEWRKEAERRGLWHLRTLPEAVQQLGSEKNIHLFESLGVLSKREMLVQQHTLYENFSKTIAIESACLLDMATSYILPAAFEFRSKLAQSIDIKCPRQVAHLESVSKLISDLLGALENHKIAQEKAKEIDAEEHPHEQATLYRTEVFDCMGVTRHLCDSLEKVVDDKLWPFPKYSEILFMK